MATGHPCGRRRPDIEGKESLSETRDDRFAMGRILFDADRSSAEPCCGEEGSAASSERVEHDLAGVGELIDE